MKSTTPNGCPQCGKPRPAGVWEELCPTCLARLSFGLGPEDDPLLDGADSADNPSPGNTGDSFGQTGTRFGDYELLAEIGRGGMGVVYRALQISLNRLVAVKMIPFGPLAGEEAVRRFRVEAQAAAQLRHPNIITIHEVGERGGQQFFSMEYVEGGTLDDLLRPGPLPGKRAAQYLQTIAQAVQHAHQHGILHRDLKPSNILIDQRDQPRIADFGLARRLAGDSTLTLTGQMLGSPNYMPPEQATVGRNEPSPGSDVYSLGAVLYHAITGRPPFQAESVEALLVQLLNHDPAPPRLLVPSVARDLETICLKCLQKESSRRYASAEELADELGRFLRDEPVYAKPAGPAEKIWRWCRRKPALAATLALLLTVGLIGAAGVLWEWRRAETAGAETRSNLYAADMELAHRSFGAGDIGRARQLLERYLPTASDRGPDLRGWEWRYLWQAARGEEWTMLGKHPAAVVALDYSPDGRWLASADIRGNLKIWDLAARREQLATNLLAGRINCLAFAPGNAWLAHSTAHGQIWLWDTRTWQRVGGFGQNAVLHLAFAQDGKLIATTDGREVTLWTIPGLQAWQRIPTATNRPMPKLVAFASDGRTLAIGDANGRVIYWDYQEDVEQEQWQVRAHRPSPDWEGTIEEMSFSPVQNLLATAGGDRAIRLWTRPRQHRPLTNHTEAVVTIAFSPDGRQLLSGSMDQSVRWWDIARQRELARWQAHAGGCLKVRFGPDGKSFASAGVDGEVKLWKFQTQPPSEQSRPLPERVVDAAVFANPALLAMTTADQGWQMWRLPNFEPLHQGTGLNSLDLSLKGVCHGRLIEWNGAALQSRNVTNGQVEPLFISDYGEVSGIDLSRDGRTLAVSAQHGIVVWDIPSRKPTRRWETPHQGADRHIRLSPDGSCLVTLQRFDGAVTFTDIATGRMMALPGYIIGASTLGFSADGRWLAPAGLGASLRVYDVPRRSEHISLPTSRAYVTALAFSPDNRRLAGGTSKGPIIVWDLGTGREVGRLIGHEGSIYSVAFLDANTLASTTHKEVRLWQAPALTAVQNISSR